MRNTVISFLLLSSLFLSCNSKNKEENKLNESDYNFELVGYKTPNVNFQKFKGEVIFLNYWGSWCPPCRAEMPSLQALYNKYGDQVKFVFISMEEPSEDYQKYLEEENFTFPAYQATTVIPAVLKPMSFPTTYIIDKYDNIVLKRGTARDWNEEDIHQILDSLIIQ